MSEKSYRGLSMHVYEVRPRKDKRGVDLISDALPVGRLWYGEPNAEMTMTAGARLHPGNPNQP